MPTPKRIEDAAKLTNQACDILHANKVALQIPELEIVTLEQFLADTGKAARMTRAEREAILSQAQFLIEHLYPHLPFKVRNFPGNDLLMNFKAVRDQVDTLSDFDFHTCMLLLFAAFHDAHTAYTLPSPFQGTVAFLPFQLRYYRDGEDRNRFVVGRVMATNENGGFDHPLFGIGAEITKWDSMDIESAARSAAQLQPGSSVAAELNRGTARLTSRAIGSASLMGFGAPPFQIPTRSVVTYIPANSTKERHISFPWHVARNFGSQTPFTSTAFSISESLCTTNCLSKYLFRPDKAQRPVVESIFEVQFATSEPQQGMPHPTLLANASNPARPFGYIRIRNFAGDLATIQEDSILRSFQEILVQMNEKASGGLILDIRGNPGGQIRVAERMLQMLTPRTIRPVQFHFALTNTVSMILDHFRAADPLDINGTRAEFEAWLQQQVGDELTEDSLTPGRPITPPERANNIGQVYQGPVILLFDSLTYSAADIFAAGFQDHDIGELIGVDPSTGGGGANVWRYQDILDNIPRLPGLPLTPLPRDCNISLAIRRATRTGSLPPMPIEDIGVEPNFVHDRTLRDIFDNNADLFGFACGRLTRAKVARIDIQQSQKTATGLSLTLLATNIRFLMFRLDGLAIHAAAITPGVPQTFSVPTSNLGRKGKQLAIEGYAQPVSEGEEQLPLAAPRIILEVPQAAGIEFTDEPPVSEASLSSSA